MPTIRHASELLTPCPIRRTFLHKHPATSGLPHSSHRNLRIASALRRSQESAFPKWGQIELTSPHVPSADSSASSCNRAHLYNWRRAYGGMDTDAAKELKELREQNARLKRLLAEAELEKDALREVTGKF
jgi:putative transposase